MVKAGRNGFKFIGWGLLLIVLFTGYLISFFEDLNTFFLSLLISEIVLVFIYIRRFYGLQITLARIILGCVFIYSGLVKGIDPVGTEFRIVDYFIAFGMDWANPLALPLSVILNATEFILGVLLVFNINIKITSWLVISMMAVFTVVTINDAVYNPVPDCGCFGDALVITNWQTLYKNLIINAFVIIIFLSGKRSSRWLKPKVEWGIFIVFIMGITGFEIYNIRHLPVMDFREWKEGNKMVNANPLPLEYYLTYRNIETGKEKEYLSPDYPYNDSVWMSKREFIRQRIVDSNPQIHDLKIDNEIGDDITPLIIENPDYQFILVSYDLSKADLKRINEIRGFINICNDKGISFVVLTSSVPDEAEMFIKDFKLDADIYFADDIVLMAMIRSNPGLILLKDAVVLKKWHYNDFPAFEELNFRKGLP